MLDAAVLSAPSPGLDPESAVCSLEPALGYTQVLHPGADLASQGHCAVTEGHQAVPDGVMVRALVEPLSQLDLSGLDGDAVIAHGEPASDDLHVVAGLGVQGVRVRTDLRRRNGDIEKGDVVREERMQLPGGRVAGFDPVHRDVFTAVEEQEPRPCDGILLEGGPEIAVLGVSVHSPGADDGDALSVGRAEKGLVHGHRVAFESSEEHFLPAAEVRRHTGDDRIALPLGGSEKDCAFRELHGHVALQRHGQGEICSGGEVESSALRQVVDGGLDGGRVLSDSVSLRAEGGDIHCTALLGSCEFSPVREMRPFRQDRVLCVRLQSEDGKHVGVLLGQFPVVHSDPEGFRGIKWRVVFQFKAGRHCADKKGLHLCAFLFASETMDLQSCFICRKSRSKAV